MGPIERAAAAVLAALAVLAGGLVLPGVAVAEPALPGPSLLAAGETTTLMASAAPVAVVPGQPTTLSGRLVDPATGAGVPGAQVRLESLATDGAWVEVADAVTDPEGWSVLAQAPTLPTTYRLHHGEPGAPQESVSPPVTVDVRSLTASLSRTAVRAGATVTVDGAKAGRPGSWVSLERKAAGSWVRVERARTAADRTYSFTVTPSLPGYSRYRVVGHGTATVTLPLLEAFRLHSYSVTTRGRIWTDMALFRQVVAETLNHPRGWARGHLRFREVRSGGDFTVVLSNAGHLRSFSSVCSSFYSCRVGRYVVINQDRFRKGSPYFPGTLTEYRQMVINHETGHWLGRGHAYCSGRGKLAPVMQQQSKGMHGCRVNAWPLGREVRGVS
ncbi:MAG TPA: DUF3152 domain-containing protein [Actinomycetes bacterium]|nr:DUF3152 domain-containing protein [Actinomycetes bacterium]